MPEIREESRSAWADLCAGMDLIAASLFGANLEDTDLIAASLFGARGEQEGMASQ